MGTLAANPSLPAIGDSDLPVCAFPWHRFALSSRGLKELRYLWEGAGAYARDPCVAACVGELRAGKVAVRAWSHGDMIGSEGGAPLARLTRVPREALA